MSAGSLLVLGGARSGKSRYAQQRAEALTGRHVFIATAEAWDDEMRDRIARHRADRDQRWDTIDAPLNLPTVIKLQGPETVVLVDCLTLWLTNVMLAGQDIAQATLDLLTAIDATAGHVILVANEVGLGIVPDSPLGRRFRDEAGRLNQAVAAHVDEVQFLVAGLPMSLKAPGGRVFPKPATPHEH